jgi:AcrR family transcriptional regulator
MVNKIVKKARGRPRAFDEGEVLREAQELFLSKGFEDLAYDDVATATGLAKPSLYNAFGDKAALFERALGDYASYAKGAIVESLSAGNDLTDGGRKLLLAAADVYAGPHGPSAGCLLVGTALPACLQHDGVRRILTEFIAELEAALEQVVARRFKVDAKRAGKTPRAVALHLTSLLFSLAVRARTGVSRAKLRAVAGELAELV